MKEMTHWQDSANAVLGVWLIFSPLVLGFTNQFTAVVNVVIVGILLLATALGAIFVPQGLGGVDRNRPGAVVGRIALGAWDSAPSRPRRVPW